MIDDHRARPGPGYWDWRCLECSEPVDDHASVWWHARQRAGAWLWILAHPVKAAAIRRYLRRNDVP